jgi:hypothetical protein
MAHPIYELAAADYDRALAEFKRVAPEAFASFIRSQNTMAEYRDVPALPTQGSLALHNSVRPSNVADVGLATSSMVLAVGKRPVAIRALSEAARVTAASETYLRGENGRRTSGQITKALLDAGVSIGGGDFAAQAARVSAHLSHSDKFNNSRTEGGYQLASWSEAPKAAYA